ncbi:MAG: hypothetical protein WBW71_04070 [Bacteroidota bacterium]
MSSSVITDNRETTREKLIKDLTVYPEDSVYQRAARLGCAPSTLYRLIAKWEFRGLLSKDRNTQQELIRRIADAHKRIEQFKQENTIASIEDVETMRLHQQRIDEATLNPLRQAKMILYHNERLFIALVADIDRKLQIINALYEKQIRDASEFSAVNKAELVDAIRYFGNMTNTVKSVERLTNSVSRAWEIVLEYQARETIQPAVILDVLAKHLKGTNPEALRKIADEFRAIQKEHMGIVTNATDKV